MKRGVIDLPTPKKWPICARSEFAKHKELAKALKTTVFFAHPYASWEKGAIENTNKLYRQYIPKGASFADYTEQEIKQIQYLLNDRPRKKNQLSITKTIFFRTLQKIRCI